MRLGNNDIVGYKFGEWTSSLTPDGVIMWSKPTTKTIVFATPHYDTLNEVAVDVALNFEDEDAMTLHSSFKIEGLSLEKDRTMYLIMVESILNSLK